MELTQLLQFKTIAECDTITEAAEKLHISQPALSAMLRKLEDELGILLFDCKRNRMKINPAGELALVHANIILAQAEEMKEELSEFAKRENTIRAGFCDPGPMWYFVPQFSISHPHIELKTKQLPDTAKSIELLSAGKYDILITREKLENSEINSIPFVQDRLLLSVPQGHALEERKQIFLREEFPEQIQKIVQFYVGGEFFEKQQRPFWEQFSEKVQLALYDDFFTFTQMVRGTDALTVSTELVQHYRDDGDGRILIPLIDPELTVQYYLSYAKKSRKHLMPLLDWITLTTNNFR